MLNRKTSRLTGFHMLETVGLALLIAAPSFAQRHETFAERPLKRQEKVREARERSQREKEEARQWAKARGLKMRHDDGRQLIELMAIRNGRPVYYSTKNFNAAISTGAYQVRNTAPFGVNGSNVTVGIWDGGSVLSTHVEFATGRVTVKDGSSDNYHATHVGGTIAAKGVSPFAQGMAPSALISSYDWTDDVSEMTAAAAAAPGQTGKIFLSNHSYGYVTGWEWDSDTGDYYWYGDGWDSSAVEEYFGQYVSEARQWDDIVYDAPCFLPFKAAGNDRNDNPPAGSTVHNGSSGAAETYNTAIHPKGDGIYSNNGFDTIGPVGTAKNVMTVGAVDDAVSGVSRSLSNADITTFSGWGPADDGRIKPDIVANGYGVNSADNDNDSDYITLSGTSMATPNAAGSAALLVDYYQQRFPSDAMRASTLKGLIIHTADDLGNPGPDYSYGWGLMNTKAAADLIKDYADGNPLRMTEALLHSSTNQSDSFSIFSGGVEPLRVTLCWTDPPGTSTTAHDNRTERLVNDLDLKVIGPGGINYPYKLSYTTPSADATVNSENNVDNVEQVYIATPVAGQYTIQIDYDGSLTDSKQWYSLLASGIAVDSDADELPDYWESLYFDNPTGAVATIDSDGDGADNLTEYISGFDPTNAASVFEVTSHSPSPTGTPFIIHWDPVAGRIYNVLWTESLLHIPFTSNISPDLPYPANSYTDWVDHADAPVFYRIDVRLDQ